MKSSSYRPEIDGLRAVAVLSVVLYHAGLSLPGGFVGVDVFFVISGYLITGTITRDVDAGRWSLREFYARRVRRILPASTVVLISSVLFAYLLYVPNEYIQIGEAGLWQAAFSSNLYFLQHIDYFGVTAQDHPFLHFWSLAVEEQFYLVYPLLAVAFYRRSRSAMLRFTVYGCGISLLVATWYLLTREGQVAAYYLPHARAWELLAGGCLSALPLASISARIRGVIGWLGLAGIMWPAVTYSASTQFPGLAALPPVAGACAVIWSQSQGVTAVGRLLAWRPIVGIGLISYSLYLWHWPVLVFGRLITPEHLPITLPLSLLLAYSTWRWVEQPFIRRRTAASLRSTARLGLACVACTAIIMSTVVTVNTSMVRDLATPPAFNAPEVQARNLPRLGDLTGPGPRFVLWGDSHAERLVQSVERQAQAAGVWGYQLTRSSTVPAANVWQTQGDLVLHSAHDYQVAAMDLIEKEQIPLVFVAARWGYYCGTTQNGQLGNLLSRSATAVDGPEESLAVFHSGVAEMISRVQAHGRIVIFTQPPELRYPPKRPLISRWYPPVEDYTTYCGQYEDAFATADVVIDTASYLEAGDTSVYTDRDHLNPDTVGPLEPAIRAELDRVAIASTRPSSSAAKGLAIPPADP